MGSGDALLPQPARPRRARLVPTIGSLLVLLVLVPLGGAAYFAAQEYERVSDSGRRAEAITGELSRLVEYSELRSSLLDERNWSLVVDGIADVGVSASVVEHFVGVDVEGEQREAVASVDRLADSIDGVDLTVALAALRAPGADPVARSDGYLELERDVAILSDELLLDVRRTAGLLADGDRLIEALQVLEAATAARTAVTMQLSTYLAAHFLADDEGRSDVATLIREQAAYDTAIAGYARIADAHTRSAAAHEALGRSPAVADFAVAIDAFTQTTLAAGDRRVARTLDRLIDEIDTVATTLEAGVGSASRHGDLVTAAGADAAEHSAVATERAARSASTALWAIGGLTVLSLGSALALARFIARPLRRMAAATLAVRRGVVPSGDVVNGPMEVRRVGTAVIEAAAHVALAEQQARALAKGDLDAAVLSETAPGLLGASLQEAVHTLAATMHDRELSRQRLAHDAAHDGLTDLLNRNACLALLERRVQEAQDGRGDLAVMFIDLDDFKSVNDRMGHLVGDHVLRTVAKRLTNTVRDQDAVARFGGDEFVVFVSVVDGADTAIALAERIRRKVSDPVPYEDDIIFRIDASIGVAMTGPGDDTSAEELLRAADVAVYRAKESGRGRIVVSETQPGDVASTSPDPNSALPQEPHAAERDERVVSR
ncbi:MAG: GGDEF domain-containing protein [Ilumatobacter sp.]|nr:GGDEF domain-containing protein [Ilumatobacter sp.]